MPAMINLFVVSPDTRSERRFDPHITIGKLKDKLELITGIPSSNQVLTLYASETDDREVAKLDDDLKPIGFYGAFDRQVVDTNPATSFTGQLTDVSGVDKFELTDGDYSKIRGTVQQFLRNNQMGRFAPEGQPTDAVSSGAICSHIAVGARCEIESLESGLSKRGSVRFVGETKFSPGVWVGVEYDEPLGKNDGSVNGERYFTCLRNYGAFVRPERVKVGDFPEEDIGVEEM